MNRDAARLLKAAIGYAAAGWHVFPLPPRSKNPIEGGGFHNATNDVDQVREWWEQRQCSNIGFYPGPSGLVGIDVDGAAGEEAAVRLGLLAEPTLTCITGRDEGGRHLYYQHPGFHVSNRDLAPYLQVRGDAGLTVLPPSIHPSGNRYRWDRTTRSILPLPPQACDTLRALQDGNGQRDPLDMSDVVAGLEPGNRHPMLVRLIGRWIGKGLPLDEVVMAALGVNAKYCNPPKPDQEITDIVEWTATQQANGDADRTRVIPLNEWKRRRGVA